MSEPAFPADDDNFQEWQRVHPSGYIINAPQSSDGPMMWHQAQCKHLYGDYKEMGSYLNKIKACASNPAALALWAKQRANPLTYCQDCQSVWERRG